MIIGSSCIKFHFPDFPREPSDLDIVCKKNQYLAVEEVKKVEKLENPILLALETKGVFEYASPNLLYTLKMSHAVGWDIKWSKHIFDIQFLKSKGCKLDIELFYKLYEYWNTVHEKNKRSDLEMSAEDFFDNNLKCSYNHDELHTIINPVPTYTKVLKDGAEVEVSEEKFNNLSFEDKCNLVYEECEIMSYERYSNMDYRHAYSKMLKKFILNHCNLWQAIFIIENFVYLHKPRNNYFKIIENGISKIKQDIGEFTISK